VQTFASENTLRETKMNYSEIVTKYFTDTYKGDVNEEEIERLLIEWIRNSCNFNEDKSTFILNYVKLNNKHINDVIINIIEYVDFAQQLENYQLK